MEKQNVSDNKLTDKAFSSLILVSFLSVFVCIVCLCSVTIAWFAYSFSDDDNASVAAECLLTVAVYEDGAADPLREIGVRDDAVIAEAGTYSVGITLPSGSASGYLVISASGVDHYVEPLARDDSGIDKTINVTLVIKSDTKVTLTPTWGIYSGECDIADGGVFVVD